MTVRALGKDPHQGSTLLARCVWFDEKNKPHERDFPVDLLAKASHDVY